MPLDINLLCCSTYNGLLCVFCQVLANFDHVPLLHGQNWPGPDRARIRFKHEVNSIFLFVFLCVMLA